MVKISRQEDGYVITVNRKRMVLKESDYIALSGAISAFEDDSQGDLVALAIDDKGFITVTRPLNPVAEDVKSSK